VDPLSDRQRAELTSARAAAERLLRAATVTFDLVVPQSPAAQLSRSTSASSTDGSSQASNPATAQQEPMLRRCAPRGAFLVIRSDDSLIGCGGLQTIDDDTGEIKRMWIHPDWRGLGLAHRLLRRLEAIARERGRTRVALDKYILAVPDHDSAQLPLPIALALSATEAPGGAGTQRRDREDEIDALFDAGRTLRIADVMAATGLKNAMAARYLRRLIDRGRIVPTAAETSHNRSYRRSG
jgi:GNAT superfamily N-acetyltransferase